MNPAGRRPIHLLMSPLATPAPPARPPWRALAMLTVAVGAVHLLLLALAPTAVAPAPSPLVNSFSTRTIVIAPPAPPGAAAPAPPAVAAAQAAAAAPPARAPRPRAAARPRPATPATADAMDQAPTPKTALTRREAMPEEPASDAPPRPPPDATAAAPSPTAAASEAAAANAVSDPGATTPGDAAATAAAGNGSASGAGASGASVASGAGGTRSGPVALQIPGSVRLLFAVTGQQGTSPMQGVFGELTWLQDGAAYDARLSLTLLFKTLRSQHSTGAIGATGIEPRRFSDTRKSEMASHFVRDRGEVVFSSNAPTAPLLAGAQDRLSVVMQLGGMLAGNPARYPAGSTIAVQTVGPRDADVWTFQVDGEETLALPAGEMVARRLTRSPRRPYDDKVELWVAPALGYLPVRIKQTQANGDFADMQLREQAPVRPPG